MYLDPKTIIATKITTAITVPVPGIPDIYFFSGAALFFFLSFHSVRVPLIFPQQMASKKPLRTWWGSSMQVAISDLIHACARGNLRLRCHFGLTERSLFVPQFPEAVFAALLQGIVKNVDMWNSVGDWEYFVENLFGEEKDICEWKKPSLNEVGRRKERDNRFVRADIRDTKWAFDLRSVVVQDLDLSQPLNLMQRGIRLRQRKTCQLRAHPAVYLHFDLMSEGVATPASTVQERRILLEVLKPDPLAMDRAIPVALAYLFNLVTGSLTPSLPVGFLLNPTAVSSSASSSALSSKTRKQGNEDVVLECIPLMTEFRTAKGGLEFEGRIGSLIAESEPQPHYRFVPGVTREHFYLLLDKIEQSVPVSKVTKWTSPATEPSPWVDSTDLFWDNVRGTKTRETTMTGKTAMQLIIKSTLRSLNIRSSDRPYAFRMSLKTETKIRNDPVPRPRPSWFRFKRRRSFLYKGMCRYDFTIVGEGATEEGAIRGIKVYEIEYEALPPSPHSVIETDVAEMVEELSRLSDPEEYSPHDMKPCTLTIARDELAFLDL